MRCKKTSAGLGGRLSLVFLVVAGCMLGRAVCGAETVIPGGQITSDTVWTAAASPYVLTGTVSVRSSSGASAVKLTIEPGVEVRFASGVELKIGIGSSNLGLLVAKGTQDQPIVFTSSKATPAPGDWGGLSFNYRLSGQTSELQYATIQNAGASGQGAISCFRAALSLDRVTVRQSSTNGLRVDSSSTVTVTASTFEQNNQAGLSVGTGATVTVAQGTVFSANGTYGCDAASAVQLRDSAFTNNTSGAMRLDARYLTGIAVSGNTFSGPNTSAIILSGTAITADVTWPKVDLPYLVSQTLSVHSSSGASAVKLTIEPGVEVRFASGVELKIGIGSSNLGLLVAKGTQDQPIVFTSSKATPAPGDWGGLSFNYRLSGRTSELQYATIQNAGASGQGAISCFRAALSLDRVTVRQSSTNGLRVDSSSTVTVTASTFEQNNQAGLSVGTGATVTVAQGTVFSANGTYGCDAASAVQLRDSAFTNNTSGAMRLDARYLTGIAVSGNTFSGPNTSAIILSGTAITADVTWPKVDLPYLVSQTLSVHSSSGASAVKLTIEPGVEVRFATGATLQIGIGSSNLGLLVAKGTQDQPIVFTSSKATPAPGDWGGLSFNYRLSGQTSELQHAIVRYAQYAVKTYAAEVAIGQSQVVDHSAYGVYTTSATPVVGAAGNWWGAPSGPNAPDNPGGRGAKVTSGVAYSPWLVCAGPVSLQPDDDCDGLSNADERNVYHTDPNNKDTDGDGLEDGAEVAYWGANWNADFDGDGLINLLDPDSDGDGMPDGWEIAMGMNPGLDDRAGDLDGDGASNYLEFRIGTDPRDPASVPVVRIEYGYDSRGSLRSAVPTVSRP